LVARKILQQRLSCFWLCFCGYVFECSNYWLCSWHNACHTCCFGRVQTLIHFLHHFSTEVFTKLHHLIWKRLQFFDCRYLFLFQRHLPSVCSIKLSRNDSHFRGGPQILERTILDGLLVVFLCRSTSCTCVSRWFEPSTVCPLKTSSPYLSLSPTGKRCPFVCLWL